MKNSELLDSWKAISSYLNKNIRTCYRWEKELGLPVHRYSLTSRSKVFAYKSEIDKWLESKMNERKAKEGSISFPKRNIAIAISSVFLIITIACLLVILSNSNSIPIKVSKPTIAILPLQYPDSSSNDKYLGMGISNELIDYLISGGQFNIIPSAISSKYTELNTDLISICDEFEIDYVLGGSITRYEETIKLSFVFTHLKDEQYSVKFECEEKLENIYKIKGEVYYNLISSLKLSPVQIYSRVNEARPQNFESFSNYLVGKNLLNNLENDDQEPQMLYYQGKYYENLCTQDSNELAIKLFNRALELDDKFAPAYIGLANCYSNNVNQGWNNDIYWLNKAEQLLREAESISNNLPEYYYALAKIYTLNYLSFDGKTKELAFKALSSGLSRFPEHPKINMVSSYLNFLRYGETGDLFYFNEALKIGERSFWLNPFSVSGNIFLVEILILNREFERAIEVININKKIDASNMSNFRLGEIHYYSGDLNKSELIFNSFESPLNYKTGALFYLGMIAAQRDEIEKAQNIIKQLQNTPFDWFVDGDLHVASIHFGLGDQSMGFHHLDLFFSYPMTDKIKYQYLLYAKLDPNFENYLSEIQRRYFSNISSNQ